MPFSKSLSHILPKFEPYFGHYLPPKRYVKDYILFPLLQNSLLSACCYKRLDKAAAFVSFYIADKSRIIYVFNQSKNLYKSFEVSSEDLGISIRVLFSIIIILWVNNNFAFFIHID